MFTELIWPALLIFAVTFLGGLGILIRSWSHDTLHLFLAVGAGVFLGAVFMHLLPEIFLSGDPHITGGAILVGFLLMLLIERFLFSSREPDYAHTHKVLSISATVGLSVHAVFDGLALAAAPAHSELQSAVLLAVVAHKLSEAIALGSLLSLSGIAKGKLLLLLLFFSLMTPMGALVIAPMIPAEAGGAIMPLTALATGTFLYIATGELLPEVFHSHHRRSINLAVMLLAAASMGALTLLTHVHH